MSDRAGAMPHSHRHTRALALVACVLAATLGLRGAHAQATVPYAPARLKLSDLVDNMVQCQIHVPPEALLKAHAAYSAEYARAFAALDRELGKNDLADPDRGPNMPVLRDVQRTVQERKTARTHSVQLADAFLDQLQLAVPEDEREAFKLFRDECHAWLVGERLNRSNYEYRAPQELAVWVRMAAVPAALSAEQRKNLATARLARSTQRRAALVELTQAMDNADLREAKLAQELGVEGKSFDEAQRVMYATVPNRDDWHMRMNEAKVITLQERARFAAVELEAWKAAAPLLPAATRRYAAATFLQVLIAGGGADLGNSGGAPVSSGRIVYGRGLDVIRWALSMPGLSAARKDEIRTVCCQWLDARVAEFEKLAEAAARPDYSLQPDAGALVKVDHEFRKKIAELAGAEWLKADPRRDSTNRGDSYGVTPSAPADLPKAEELTLTPEDDALFSTPKGAAAWQPARNTALSRNFDTFRSGWPSELDPDADADAERLLAATDDERVLIATVLGDFRSAWASTIGPLLESAKADAAQFSSLHGKSGGSSRTPQEHAALQAAARKASASRRAVWAAANAQWKTLAERLAAVLPDASRSAARLWAARAQLAGGLFPIGWESRMPNIAAVGLNASLSAEGRAIARRTMAEAMDRCLSLWAAWSGAVLLFNSLDPAYMLEFDEHGVSRPGDAPWTRMEQAADAARDAYVAHCKALVQAVAAQLGESDAASLRRALNEQRTPWAAVTLREVIDALGNAPANSGARDAAAAEAHAIDEVCDQAYAVLSVLPEAPSRILSGYNNGSSTMPHIRAAVYTELAKDMRTQALCKLRPLMPPDVVERVPLFRQADAVESVGRKP